MSVLPFRKLFLGSTVLFFLGLLFDNNSKDVGKVGFEPGVCCSGQGGHLCFAHLIPSGLFFSPHFPLMNSLSVTCFK